MADVSFNSFELSDLLGVNPETVRRWIRSGKLDAYQYSRKDGNVISCRNFATFLLKNEKYLSIMERHFRWYQITFWQMDNEYDVKKLTVCLAIFQALKAIEDEV